MNIIKVPQEKLVALIEKAYDLSRAQGMGVYHYVAGPLPEGQAQAYIDAFKGKTIHLDYFMGRAIKLTIFREDGYYLEDTGGWFDHSFYDWQELLKVLE